MATRIIDGYLNSGQAAEHLGLHPTTLLRLSRERKIRHRRVGRRIYFSEMDLREYIDSMVVEPNPEGGVVELKHLHE